MSVLDSVKSAPRWAWVTAGGIGIGAAGIKLWKGRDKPASEVDVVAQDGSAPYGGPAPTTSQNPVATIVPPVIIQGQNSDPNAGVGGLQELYISAVGDIVHGWSDIWGPVMTTQMALAQGNAQTIQDLALAGSAPNSAPTPAALVTYAPPEPVAPVALPYVAPYVAPTQTVADPCTGEYPNQSAAGCYKVVCATGKGDHAKGRWHYYKNGREVRVATTC